MPGGIAFGLGTFFYLYVNGMMLGVIGAACHQYGMSVALWSFVAPHGSLELPSILIAGGAGFRLGYAMLFPGSLRWKDSVAQGGIEATRLVSGMIPMLVDCRHAGGILLPLACAGVAQVHGRRPAVYAAAAVALPAGEARRQLFKPCNESSLLLRPEVVIAAVLLCCRCWARPSFPARHCACADAAACRRYCGGPRFCVCRMRWSPCPSGSFAGMVGALCAAAGGDRDPAEPARVADPAHRGTWRDFLVLAVLGLAVDLRWFEPAWPAGLAAIGKMLLLDAGIFGFLAVRQLDGVGFDLRLKCHDARIGLREFCFYAPIAILLGLALGFLHFHAAWPRRCGPCGAFVFTFLFIAIPEELFFRGWLQNLLERRLGRTAALMLTAVLFGLAHWNKRTASFNWRYVLLAALAGFSMAGRGALSGAWGLPPSPTQPSIPCGRSG